MTLKEPDYHVVIFVSIFRCRSFNFKRKIRKPNYRFCSRRTYTNLLLSKPLLPWLLLIGDLTLKIMLNYFPVWRKTCSTMRKALLTSSDSTATTYTRVYTAKQPSLHSEVTIVLQCFCFFSHLYSKGDHDTAVQQYIKTIGNLEASYVIRKVDNKITGILSWVMPPVNFVCVSSFWTLSAFTTWRRTWKHCTKHSWRVKTTQRCSLTASPSSKRCSDSTSLSW